MSSEPRRFRPESADKDGESTRSWVPLCFVRVLINVWPGLSINVAADNGHTIAWPGSIPIMAILTAIAFISPAVAVAGFVAVIIAYVLPLAALIARTGRRLMPARGGVR